MKHDNITVIGERKARCPCCMENHIMKLVIVHQTYMGHSWDEEYGYCEKSDSYWAGEEMITKNYENYQACLRNGNTETQAE